MIDILNIFYIISLILFFSLYNALFLILDILYCGTLRIFAISFWWYISTSELYGAIMYVFPILLIIISSYNIFNILHSGFLRNITLIIEYKKAILIYLIGTLEIDNCIITSISQTLYSSEYHNIVPMMITITIIIITYFTSKRKIYELFGR